MICNFTELTYLIMHLYSFEFLIKMSCDVFTEFYRFLQSIELGTRFSVEHGNNITQVKIASHIFNYFSYLISLLEDLLFELCEISTEYRNRFSVQLDASLYNSVLLFAAWCYSVTSTKKSVRCSSLDASR